MEMECHLTLTSLVTPLQNLRMVNTLSDISRLLRSHIFQLRDYCHSYSTLSYNYILRLSHFLSLLSHSLLLLSFIL